MPPKLPRSVQEIADVIGHDLAVRLVEMLPRAYTKCHPAGKCILYVPKRLPLDHRLVQLIGWEAAQKMCQAFGGEILHPATCSALTIHERNLRIMELIKKKVPVSQIAKEFGLTESHVWGIRRAGKIAEEAANENRLNTSAA